MFGALFPAPPPPKPPISAAELPSCDSRHDFRVIREPPDVYGVVSPDSSRSPRRLRRFSRPSATVLLSVATLASCQSDSARDSVANASAEVALAAATISG